MRLSKLLDQKVAPISITADLKSNGVYSNGQLGHIMSPVFGESYRGTTDVDYGREVIGLQIGNINELYVDGIGDTLLMLVFPNVIYPTLVDWLVTERILETPLDTEKNISDSLTNCITTNPTLHSAIEIHLSVVGEQNIDRLLYHAYSKLVELVSTDWLDITMRNDSPLDWQKVFVNLLSGDNELSTPEAMSAMFFVSTLYKIHLLNIRIFNAMKHELRYSPSKIISDTVTSQRVCDWFHTAKHSSDSEITKFIKWL